MGVPEQVFPAVSLGQAWSSFWANVFNFRGRATRAEYWWMALLSGVFQLLVIVPLSLLPGPFSALLSLGVAVLSLGLFVRRFHDAGFSTPVAILAVVGQAVLLMVGLGLLVAGVWPAVSGAAFDPDLVAGELLLAGAALLGLGSVVGAFVFVVTLLPSRPDNRYGPQRAGRVPLPAPPAD